MTATGTTSPSISWHMKRLAADGIVESYCEGRKTMYLLAPDAAVALRAVRRKAARTATPESGAVPG
jgi:DNA-binding transcriptional ArsR family regulator